MPAAKGADVRTRRTAERVARTPPAHAEAEISAMRAPRGNSDATEGHVTDNALHDGALGFRVLVNSRVPQQIFELRDLSFLVIYEEPTATHCGRRHRDVLSPSVSPDSHSRLSTANATQLDLMTGRSEKASLRHPTGTADVSRHQGSSHIPMTTHSRAWAPTL